MLFENKTLEDFEDGMLFENQTLEDSEDGMLFENQTLEDFEYGMLAIVDRNTIVADWALLIILKNQTQNAIPK